MRCRRSIPGWRDRRHVRRVAGRSDGCRQLLIVMRTRAESAGENELVLTRALPRRSRPVLIAQRSSACGVSSAVTVRSPSISSSRSRIPVVTDLASDASGFPGLLTTPRPRNRRLDGQCRSSAGHSGRGVCSGGARRRRRLRGGRRSVRAHVAASGASLTHCPAPAMVCSTNRDCRSDVADSPPPAPRRPLSTAMAAGNRRRSRATVLPLIGVTPRGRTARCPMPEHASWHRRCYLQRFWMTAAGSRGCGRGRRPIVVTGGAPGSN